MVLVSKLKLLFRKKKLLIGVVIFVLLAIAFIQIRFLNRHKSEPCLVLYWTKVWGGPHGLSFATNRHFCPTYSDCTVTTDRSRLFEAQVIMFYLFDLRPSDLSLVKLEHQRWILVNYEPPSVIKDLLNRNQLRRATQRMDHFMTHLKESDIYTPYGLAWIPRSNRTVQPRYNLKVPLSERTKSVAWFVSNCKTDSGRENIAHSLARHVQVDIYGKCGPNKCPKSDWDDCFSRIGREYKFYLAFENSLCKDYITEKLFNILKQDIIPVVYGGVDYGQYREFLPEGSYIDVRNFSSIRELGSYLTRVSSNEQLFNSYFDWKRKFENTITHTGVIEPCRVCEFMKRELIGQKRESNRGRDFFRWFEDLSQCETDHLLPNYFV